MKYFSVLLLISVFLVACGPKKVVESTYKNGNPNVVRYYDKVNGERQLVKEVVYYENENKKLEGDYANNKRSGHWKAWYEDGKLWSEGEYKDGKRNGPGIVYHENGNKYIESNYSNDEKTGKWRFFDSTGKLIQEVDYDLLKSVRQHQDNTPKK